MGMEDFLYLPYEYFDDATKFDETSLASKSAFYNSLTEQEISDRDYEHAQRVWRHFGITNFRQYRDHYLNTDVLLLAGVFGEFHQTMIDAHSLDFLHFSPLYSMTLQLSLKITAVQMELITDPDIYLMIESDIRGGLSYVSQRHSRAQAPLLPGHRPQETTFYLAYWDCNSYATYQMYSLPVGDFRFLSQDEIDSFDVNSIDKDSSVGCVNMQRQTSEIVNRE